MPISAYLRQLRDRIGHDLLVMPGVAGIIRDSSGRILLQQRSEDLTWDLPGGVVDPGEAPAHTLVREVREETGLIVIPERLVGVFGGLPEFRYTYPNGDVVEYTDILFECRVIGGQLDTTDSETAALRYFPPDALPQPHTLLNRYPQEIFSWPPPTGRALFY